MDIHRPTGSDSLFIERVPPGPTEAPTAPPVMERMVGWLAQLEPRQTVVCDMHGSVCAADAISAAKAAMAEIAALRHEAALLRDRLSEIGEYAHDRSTGPAVPDALWEIRSMAYDDI